MTTETEFSGKDIEEAIKNACSSLNLTQEQLNIKVSSPGSNGIFGLLKKKAVIRVSIKTEEQNFIKTGPSLGRQQSKKDPRKRNSKKRYPKEKLSQKKLSQSSREKNQRPAKELTPEITAEIQNATEKIISLMGYEVEVSISQTRGQVHVQLAGDHIENIIGEEGSILDALQYLVRKIASQKFSEKIMLSMDAGNFRETRKKELQELALEMARIVKEGKKHRIIAPLNPAERRIIHVALQTDSTIRSKSIGEGLFKKIKIYLPGQGRRHHGKRRPHHNKPKNTPKR